MDKYTFPAVILAGGNSSRMKQDKALLPFGSYASMTQYQYTKLQNIFQDVFISSKNDKFDFLQKKEKLLLDKSDIASPMIALQTIFTTLPNEYIFIIAVDIPLIKYETIQALYNSFIQDQNDIVIAKDTLGNVHNLCGIFHRNILKDIESLLDQDIHKINFLIKNSKYREVLIDDDDQFINLNDKKNYEKACKLLEDQPPVK